MCYFNILPYSTYQLDVIHKEFDNISVIHMYWPWWFPWTIPFVGPALLILFIIMCLQMIFQCKQNWMLTLIQPVYAWLILWYSAKQKRRDLWESRYENWTKDVVECRMFFQQDGLLKRMASTMITEFTWKQGHERTVLIGPQYACWKGKGLGGTLLMFFTWPKTLRHNTRATHSF